MFQYIFSPLLRWRFLYQRPGTQTKAWLLSFSKYSGGSPPQATWPPSLIPQYKTLIAHIEGGVKWTEYSFRAWSFCMTIGAWSFCMTIWLTLKSDPGKSRSIVFAKMWYQEWSDLKVYARQPMGDDIWQATIQLWKNTDHHKWQKKK